jgi:hypothetical protein
MNRELHEESNIPLESIKDTRMIAMMRSNTVHGREVQLFCSFIDLTKEEVQNYYLKGPEDQEESKGIVFLKYEDILEMIVSILFGNNFIESKSQIYRRSNKMSLFCFG